MKIIFIYLGVSKLTYPKFHHGIASLSATLKKCGHQVDLLYLPQFNSSLLNSYLAEAKPELIGVSFTSSKAIEVRQTAAFIADCMPHINVVLGGVHATVCPEECLSYRGVSAVCVGEGEASFIEHVCALDSGRVPQNIPGILVRRDGANNCRLISPPPALDELPFADRELFDYQREIDRSGRAVFLGGRGCSYQCGFCINPKLSEMYGNTSALVRRRSVENLLVEIEDVMSRYRNIKYLSFQDDTFTLDRKWLEAFCTEYGRRIGIPFDCHSRVDIMTARVASLLADANCHLVRMGIESGDGELRNQVLGKNISHRQIVNAFAIVKSYGMKTMAYNMIGIPSETRESLQKTYRLNEEVEPDLVRVMIFQPFPGTSLRELCISQGWLSERNSETLYDHTVLDQPGVDQKDLDYIRKLFRRRFRVLQETGNEPE